MVEAVGNIVERIEIDEIRIHLLKAQNLMDRIEPCSSLGARLQQLIDELDRYGESNTRQ